MTSILETFYIMFSSDASKVKKGAQEAFKSTDELETKIKNTTQVSDKLGSAFLNLARQAATAFVGIFAVQRLISETFESTHFADEIGEVAHGLGISTEQLSVWSDAAKFAGGSAQSASESFKNLSGSLAQIDATGHSRVKPFFDELGVQLEDTHGKIRPINDLLLDIAGKFEHMSKQESFGFGRKLQLDEGMIRLLQRGRAGVEELLEAQKELGVVTEEDAATGEEWRHTVDDMEHTTRTFFLGIARDLLPKLEELAKWFRENGPLIKASIEGIAAAVGTLVVVSRIGAIIAFFTKLSSVIETAIAVGGTFAGILSAMGITLTAPLWLWFVAIAGVFTAIIYKWDVLKSYIIGGIQDIRNAFASIGDFFTGGTHVYKSIFEGQQALATASSTPINSQTSNVFSHSAQNAEKNTTVTTGDININTQATDSEGIARDFTGHLKREMFQAVTNSDDGVQY